MGTSVVLVALAGFQQGAEGRYGDISEGGNHSLYGPGQTAFQNEGERWTRSAAASGGTA